MIFFASRTDHQVLEERLSFVSNLENPRFNLLVSDEVLVRFLIVSGDLLNDEDYEDEDIVVFPVTGEEPGDEDLYNLQIPFVVARRQFIANEVNSTRGYFKGGDCFVYIEPATDSAERALLWYIDHYQGNHQPTS